MSKINKIIISVVLALMVLAVFPSVSAAEYFTSVEDLQARLDKEAKTETWAVCPMGNTIYKCLIVKRRIKKYIYVGNKHTPAAQEFINSLPR